MCAGHAELEERLDKQQKSVTYIVEQQTRKLGENIEAQLAVVEALTRRAGGCDPVKPLKFNDATSWALYHQQFEAAAFQNNWTPNEKAAYLLSVLKGEAADVLHTVLTEATYEEIVGALRDHFGEHR